MLLLLSLLLFGCTARLYRGQMSTSVRRHEWLKEPSITTVLFGSSM